MDKQKKIIVGLVGGLLSTVLLVFVKMLAFPNDPTEGKNIALGDFSDAPNLDQNKFENFTKKELYDKNGKYNVNKYDSLASSLSFAERMNEKIKKDEPKLPISQVDPDLQLLMDLQKSLNETPAYEDLPMDKEVPTNREKKALPQEGNYFFGASRKKTKSISNLIPAETINAGVLTQGSTIAIRTKQPLFFPKEQVRIAKGSVIYGVVSFNQANKRLEVDISTYRRENRLYNVNINVHDFDGRQGIHINNKSIFQIPGKVAKDVFNYMYTKGTQASTFGNNTKASFDEAKVIAILSATKEVSNELFIKQKIFIPSKYHLWLNIKKD